MKNFFGVIVSFSVAALLCACTDYAQKIEDEYGPEDSSGKDGVSGEMTDYRDGRTYRTVTLGGQEWMAENLNYNTPVSLCFVYLEENCSSYGRLYGWPLDGISPDGWHVPSEAEWRTLFYYVGDNSGTKLKSTSGWKVGMSGSDDYGFSAMAAGAASYVDMETYRELNTDAKIDVLIKPTAYQNTDRCNEYHA